MQASRRHLEARAALALLGGLSAGAAHAQQAATPPKSAAAAAAAADAAEAAAEAKDEILVVGHRQHGAVATEIPPEVTLNSTAIHALGAADLTEVFDELAPEIKNAQSEPGSRFGTPIVLVNGQRIAGFSSIKDLPPEAVRRIEIFPEKVALQYGYPAGQRVVNVVLRSNYRALTLLGRYTAAPAGGRDTYRAKAELVRITDNAHWNLGFDFSHQNPILGDTTLGAPGQTGKIPAHSLSAQDDHLTLNGASTSMIGAVTAEFTARLDLDGLQSRPGLSATDGTLLTQQGEADRITGPFRRSDRTVEAQANATFNGKIKAWRWSFIGKLDETTRLTRTQDAQGAGGLDTILLPSPGLLGDRCSPTDGECVSTTTRTASGDLYLNGDLFRLPAGPVTASMRTGFSFTDLRSASPLDPQRGDLTRGEASAQANLDFPLTARDSGVGKLSVGVNGEHDQLSDFGGLSTWGSSLSWSPVEPVEFLATYSHEQQAPSLLQLGEAGLETPDLREYDFVQDTTSIVRQVTGGNLGLQQQTSSVADARLQVKPLRSVDLTLSGEYRRERIRNPIANISAATAATLAAFPDRFTRNDEGYLTGIDLNPVNLDRRDRQQLRYGVTYSTAFGPTRPAGTKQAGRNQFQIALYDTWRFQDDVVLQDGQPSLDLLGHDIISDKGGTPAHELELQTSVSTAAFSFNVNADWQAHTHTFAGPLGQDKLDFSQGISLGVKIGINLEDQHWLTRRLPFLRGNLNLSADNLLGAHTKVRDADGKVPLAYDDDYLHPTGPTFRLTLRKRFR